MSLFLLRAVVVAVLAAGVGYLLVRGVRAVAHRLLWRVRRRLILSYVFIGFVPALLIVAFFVLGAFLLFSNLSAYLVRADVQRIGDWAALTARRAAVEVGRSSGGAAAGVLKRQQVASAREFPGVSIAIVPADVSCGDDAVPQEPAHAVTPPVAYAGPWSHVAPPRGLPSWIDCGGFQGALVYVPAADVVTSTGVGVAARPDGSAMADAPADTRLLVRAVAFPDTPGTRYAVLVDVDVDATLIQQVRRDTGVQLGGITALTHGASPLVGRKSDGASAERWLDGSALPLASISLFEYRDWDSGRAGTAVMVMRMSVAEIYNRIASAPGSTTTRDLVFVLLAVVGTLFLVIESMALIAGLMLARSITGSVHELFTGTQRVGRGDFTHKIKVRAPDQLGDLARSFNDMTASIEDLLLQASEKKRLEEELRIAHDIQMSLLPHGRLDVPGLSITAVCVPAHEVGGDYYDFLPLDDDRLAVLIADVSGKGTSAALYMAELKGLVLSLSRIYTSPRALLIAANRLLAEHLNMRSFITLTYAVVDLRARTMTYARAGHTPLMYLPARGGADRRVEVLAPNGLVLGLTLDDGSLFERLLEEETISLHAGDVLLFYTDGVTEAMDVHDDWFGDERLSRLIEAHADLPAVELRERVLREIAAFVGDAPQHDDLTMIILKVEEAPDVHDRTGRHLPDAVAG
jgi:serine phosphatase RsbU (regulator of sigma subunit)